MNNREIKFRAWVKDKKVMRSISMLETHRPGLGKYQAQYYGDGNGYTNIEDIELMQFTGLKDKNGKEIYEGDIINVTKRLDDYEMYAQVIWDNEEARWGYIKADGDDTEIGSLYDLLDIRRDEIIGNIYENPELIKN